MLPYRRYPQSGKLSAPAPFIATSLFRERRATPYRLALVDSGADSCIFPTRAAKQLGLDPKSGQEIELRGFRGNPSPGWVHENIGFAFRSRESRNPPINIAMLGRVVFSEELALSGILGRASFFEAFVVSVDECGKRVILNVTEDADLVDPGRVPSYLAIHLMAKQ